MNRERLERLAVLLEGYRGNDAPRFNLQNWGKAENRRAGFLWLGQRPCNTAACAVGLACDSGIFAEDGLSYEVDKETNTLNPAFRDLQGWSAVKSFFDLGQVQATTLFAEHSYEITEGEIAAKAVAARIRQMTAPLDAFVKEPQER
ncbi:hypothetical protein [Bradyrhizobium sp. G127]|jgi:hypothetical protein|uniref:hypothetical protein n=1 Tax=Bradyrhizobium sp. G127 TaxID=2904800 RepID=UPI001F1C277D|nr:hypothetical protein [Bradyrhizobium sp. G127]MCF2524807.1 hypothetical protein [Bradyrhizobium sp. G127]